MEDSKANYLLSSENGETDSGGGFFDWPLKFMISKLSGVDYSDKPKKAALVKASERKSLYSARYFRYTVLMFIVYLMIGLGYYSGHAGFTVLDAIYFIIISFYTVGFGDYVALSESQRLFTSFYAIFGFTLLCVIGVTAGDFFHHTMRMQNSVRAKRVLDVISQARFDMKSKDVMQETEGGRTSSVAPGDQTSPRKVPSRRLSLMQPHGQGDIFPSPYSISDPRVIELMRKVNMDMFDEELEVVRAPCLLFAALINMQYRP